MFVIWLTGLPCSGKTTIANELAKRIPNMVVLDGDNLRSWLSQDDFSREGRVKHNRRVAMLAKMLVDHDVPVSVSLVFPYEENGKSAWEIIGNDRFLEVYVKCPLEVCEGRDVKGMYCKVREGKIINFTGIDDPYEEPKMPDIVVDTSVESVDECVEKVILHVSKWLKPFVLMTGWQRSGTSFLARSMNLCGVYLGPREQMNRTDLNPVSFNLRGLWESKDMWSILRKAVPRLDKTDYSNLWEDMLEPPSYSETHIAELKKLVAEYIIHPSMVPGMKIPQCLVVKAILPHLPANTVILGIFRHPLKVADSMLRGRRVPQKRWDESRSRFLNLWRINSKELLEILDARPSFLLNFDWPKERMLSEIRTIVRKLGLVETELTSWYTDELKHSDTYVDTTNFPDNELKGIYERLSLRAEQNDKVVIPSYYQPKIELKGVIRDLEEDNALLSNEIYKLKGDLLPNKTKTSRLISYVARCKKKITISRLISYVARCKKKITVD